MEDKRWALVGATNIGAPRKDGTHDAWWEYWVSDQGEVVRRHSENGEVKPVNVSPTANNKYKGVKPQGYLGVPTNHLPDKLVHRMVAKAFVPNPNGYRCVDHKDNNKHNNHYENLEWVTHGENLKRMHARRKAKGLKWKTNDQYNHGDIVE